MSEFIKIRDERGGSALVNVASIRTVWPASGGTSRIVLTDGGSIDARDSLEDIERQLPMTLVVPA